MDPRKQCIRRAFSRSAATYDAYADVQKEAAQRTALLLDGMEPGSVLEIGCATGSYTLQLANRFPASAIYGLDFAEPMLRVAAARLADNDHVHLLCADAERFLEDSTRSFDLITSNATLQWFSDLDRTFKSIARKLSDSGALVCSLFGPQTFVELRQALCLVNGHPVIMPVDGFPGKDKLLALLRQHYCRSELQEVFVVREYQSVRQFLRHLKHTGTSGPQRGTPVAMTPGRLRRMETWFLAAHGGCRVTYQLFFIRAWK